VCSRVPAEVAVEHVKVVIASGGSRNVSSILPVHYVPPRLIRQNIVACLEYFSCCVKAEGEGDIVILSRPEYTPIRVPAGIVRPGGSIWRGQKCFVHFSRPLRTPQVDTPEHSRLPGIFFVLCQS
jgi:hypothetical protein